jgi:hypothetical protein
VGARAEEVRPAGSWWAAEQAEEGAGPRGLERKGWEREEREGFGKFSFF